MSQSLSLRPTEEADCELLWRWANDAEVRRQAFSSEPIPWESHVRWFEAGLRNPNRFHYVAQNLMGEPVGQVRFDMVGDHVEVDVSVGREHRGKGYGSEVLRQGSLRLFSETHAARAVAYIKPDNTASLAAFQVAGYQPAQSAGIHNRDTQVMAMERPDNCVLGERQTYIVAGRMPWDRRVFDEELRQSPGGWHYVDQPEKLTARWARDVKPRYIFFLQWSTTVDRDIFERYECVLFHMTDVPYGRGGSPLQNLIQRGHRSTKLTALRMTDRIDAGPVYAKEDLLLDGSAEEIYIRASRRAAGMIRRIIDEGTEPAPQVGKPVVFKRRRPGDSEIPDLTHVEALYDYIRMLDAEGYPRAFLDRGALRYEFSSASLKDGCVDARVRIASIPEVHE